MKKITIILLIWNVIVSGYLFFMNSFSQGMFSEGIVKFNIDFILFVFLYLVLSTVVAILVGLSKKYEKLFLVIYILIFVSLFFLVY